MAAAPGQPTPYLLIPSVSAAQVVGSQRIHLQKGTLTLSPPPPSTKSPTATSPDAADSDPVKLLITISPSVAIPLTSSSIVGTHKDQPLSYLFTLPISSSPGDGQGSPDDGTNIAFIQIDLPETCNDPATPDAEAATAFEALLVEHGFLTAGLVADADDMSRAVKEAAAKAAANVRRYTNKRTEGDPVSPEDAHHFSNVTKKVVSGTTEGTGKAAETTGMVTDAMGNAVIGAGEYVGEKVGGIGASEVAPKEEVREESIPTQAVKQGMEATKVAFGGVADGSAHVTHTIGDSYSRIAEHEQGPEAKELVEESRTATGNVGSIAADVITGTSTVWHAGEAGVGLAKGGTAEQKAKEGDELGAAEVKETAP